MAVWPQLYRQCGGPLSHAAWLVFMQHFHKTESRATINANRGKSLQGDPLHNQYDGTATANRCLNETI